MRSGLASQRHAGASAARACRRAARRRNGPGFWSSRRVAVHRHQPQHTPRQPALPLSHVRRRDTPRRWTTGGAGPVLPRRPRLPLEQWLGLRPAEQHGGPASPLRVAMHAAGHQVRRRPGPPPTRRVLNADTLERRHRPIQQFRRYVEVAPEPWPSQRTATIRRGQIGPGGAPVCSCGVRRGGCCARSFPFRQGRRRVCL